MTHHTKYVLMAISVFICTYTIAQNKKHKTLKELNIVTYTKSVNEIAEFKRNGQSSEVLETKELQRNNSAFIEQSLGNISGVQVDKRTMLGGQRLVIRGYGNDQKFNSWGVKMYLNGMSITGADGVTILDDIDFATINKIEVIKGPAATRFGGGIGGVARFYTKTSTDSGLSIKQSVNLGSFNLLQTQSTASYTNASSSTTLNFGHIQSDGYRPHGGTNKNMWSVYSTIKLTPRQNLFVYGNTTSSFDGVSGQISYADYYAGIDHGNLAYMRKDARNESQSAKAGFSHRIDLKQGLTLSTSAFFSNFNQLRIAAGAMENSSSQNYNFRTELQWKQDINKDWENTTNIGAELQQSNSLISNYRFTGNVDTPLQLAPISKGSYFKNNNNQNSFFIMDKILYKPWNMALTLGISQSGIKYNREDLLAFPGLVSGYNKNLSFTNKLGSTINPHISLQSEYENQVFNLCYSTGYNAPTSATSFITGINKTNDNLKAERAQMAELAVQGLLWHSLFHYQVSIFTIQVQDKLTQLSGKDPVTGTAYNYWSNTGKQLNQGIELGLGYMIPIENKMFYSIEPFANASIYNFKYTDFATKIDTAVQVFDGKQVIGVPKMKYTIGLDIVFQKGFYLNNTFTSIGDVYTNFANTNHVKGFALLNSKLGYKKKINKHWDMDIYLAGNNLTNQINYTFLFLGNNVNDTDPNNGFPPGVATDVNPGPSKANFWGGMMVSYKF